MGEENSAAQKKYYLLDNRPEWADSPGLLVVEGPVLGSAVVLRRLVLGFAPVQTGGERIFAEIVARDSARAVHRRVGPRLSAGVDVAAALATAARPHQLADEFLERLAEAGPPFVGLRPASRGRTPRGRNVGGESRPLVHLRQGNDRAVRCDPRSCPPTAGGSHAARLVSEFLDIIDPNSLQSRPKFSKVAAGSEGTDVYQLSEDRPVRDSRYGQLDQVDFESLAIIGHAGTFGDFPVGRGRRRKQGSISAKSSNGCKIRVEPFIADPIRQLPGGPITRDCDRRGGTKVGGGNCAGGESEAFPRRRIRDRENRRRLARFPREGPGIGRGANRGSEFSDRRRIHRDQRKFERHQIEFVSHEGVYSKKHQRLSTGRKILDVPINVQHKTGRKADKTVKYVEPIFCASHKNAVKLIVNPRIARMFTIDVGSSVNS
ncbi:unnamed protein product, partial [Nesidiocoris tenuis]